MTYSIRAATPADLAALTAVEAASFPAAEKADEAAFAARLAAFGEAFLVLVAEDGAVVGLIDGMVINQETITDDMYENARLHDPKGRWQSVFGLCVMPACRHKGGASMLMRAFIDKARREGRRGVVLTCKEGLRGFYERFGFECRGVSASVHGGAVWFDMVLTF